MAIVTSNYTGGTASSSNDPTFPWSKNYGPATSGNLGGPHPLPIEYAPGSPPYQSIIDSINDQLNTGTSGTDYPIMNIPGVPDLPNSPTLNYNLPSTFTAPTVSGANIQQISPTGMPTLSDLMTQSNQAMGQMPQVQNYLSQIQALGQQQSDLLTQQLNRIFEPQREETMEMIASRGLLGAGSENEIMRRLAEAQGFTASQALGELQSQNMQQQIAEMQRVSGIEEQRRNQVMNLSAQLGMHSSEIESRYQLQTQSLAAQADMQQQELNLQSQLETQANNLRLAGLELEAQQLELQAAELEQNRVFRGWTMDVQRAEIIMDARGQLTDEARLDLQETQIALQTFMDMARVEGLTDEDRAAILQHAADLMADLQAGLPADIFQQPADIESGGTTTATNPNPQIGDVRGSIGNQEVYTYINGRPGWYAM